MPDIDLAVTTLPGGILYNTGTTIDDISRADLAADPAFTNKYVDKAATETQTGATLWGFVIDEDTMVSDSAVKLPTQQSVKAYVDSLIADRLETTVASRYVGYGTSLPVSGTEGDQFDLISA